ncbi:ISNCY family transposase [candidate division KSB1 bacterium]|nr:ISNCY family transposase [candidate division KSB1 bacterium]
MRQAIVLQMKLDAPAIGKIEFDLNSRHELEPILLALKHIHENPQLLKKILKLIAKDVLGDRDDQLGCPGLLYWEILVLAAVRNGCNLDFDALLDLANEHRKLRYMLGVGEWENKRYTRSTLQENLAKLTEETLREISNLIVAEGHQLVPKAIEKVRGDSVVVQANIHYPTDANLVVDGVRKVVSFTKKLGQLFSLSNWRKTNSRQKKVKQLHRQIQQACRSKKPAQQAKAKPLYNELLMVASEIVTNAFDFKEKLSFNRLNSVASQHLANKLADELDFYIAATLYVSDIAERRVLNGEKVPHTEKIFSIFETHTEMINRGKAPDPWEFGHLLYLVEDQAHFIVDFRILENGITEADILLPQMRQLQRRSKEKIKSASFDQGFYTPKNLKGLRKIVEVACLPPKGQPSDKVKEQQSTPAYRVSRRRHAGIESAIHALVWGNGLVRCPDKGWAGYRRYVALGIVGRNLQTLGTILLKRERRAAARLRQAA